MKKKSLFKFSCLVYLFLMFSIILNLYLIYQSNRISAITISAAEKIIGMNFTNSERKLMKKDLVDNLSSYEEIRKFTLENNVSPAVEFNPVVPGKVISEKKSVFKLSDRPEIRIPEKFEDIVFYPVTDLARLIKSGQITSLQLTKIYLERLKKYGPELECVVTLTEEYAIEQARKADKEIARGIYRGPLHGIPFGVKDLLATKGIRTTWGAAPYKNQLIEKNATVIKRLEEAGAVLVAKLSMGALAWGDVWFGGKTKNPWNLEQGSSGSSAGPASSTAAGLVGFSIGTETWGSIVSPSTRCRITGFRPTFGRVSRAGAMALSWSMDKIGPICRSVEDCAIVFDAIHGPDNIDRTVVEHPFCWDPSRSLDKIRIGYLKTVFEKDTSNMDMNQMILKTMRSLVSDLVPVELPDFPVNSLSFILNAEAAAAFDELTRSNQDELMVRQVRNAWPNVFREARFIPAVEYIQANRARMLLMQAMMEKMKNIDVFIAPSFQGSTLLLTNLTGHPAVVVPTGEDEEGNSTSITFIGKLFEDGKTLAVAKAFQDATGFHLKHPSLKK